MAVSINMFSNIYQRSNLKIFYRTLIIFVLINLAVFGLNSEISAQRESPEYKGKRQGDKERDYAADLIANCGFPYEIHRNILTTDGYLLTMQRIPARGRNMNANKEYLNGSNPVPVLLMHGLLGSAEHFLLLGCNESLGYMLADEGYDVWLGNVRTVSYSRHHVRLDPDGIEFWNITLDDLGTYDLPSLIDYILSTTNNKQMMYIGHSQGTMIFYIMCSNKPEYAAKVQLFVNLSPVASLIHCPHPWLGSVCDNMNTIQSFTNRYGLYEWTMGRNFVREYGAMMCSMIPSVCKYVIYLFSGLPPVRLDDESLHRLLTNCPEGIASKQFFHACNMMRDKRFEKYNYGTEENMIHYGTEDPPKYDISLTTTPTALYYSKHDWFLSENTARKIAEQIPNVVDSHQIEIEDFSHLDFVISHLAPQHLYPRIMALMDKHRNNNGAESTASRYN